MTPKETYLGLLAHLAVDPSDCREVGIIDQTTVAIPAERHGRTFTLLLPIALFRVALQEVVESVDAELFAAELQGTRIIAFDLKIPFTTP